MDIFKTENEFGKGTVKSWASILDDNTREAAEAVSRTSAVDGPVVLMPDAHFGYGPPVGTVMRTKNAVIPYAIGVDIGCGMIATRLNVLRADLVGLEGQLHGAIRKVIPSGVGKAHLEISDSAKEFVSSRGLPPGLINEAVLEALMKKRHYGLADVRQELTAKVPAQFGTLGAGNHFVEVCEGDDGFVWLVLHSGSRGIGNALATAHVKLAEQLCERAGVKLEDKNFSFFSKGGKSFDAYIADMLWAQEYAMASRENMMAALKAEIRLLLGGISLFTETVNCHHNYSEEVESGVWLTRKGAINAERGRWGIIPGSMGAVTHIVRGKGCKDALNTAPHGAGRIRSRGAAKRELDIDEFKAQMVGKTWQDRDAEKLLDEAPDAYKPIAVVMEDSRDLVESVVVLSQFINYKGI
ncbi:hypothetical protein LCGC14_1668100 [marine sediment metagenome]|uniref:3'-phosphate/5'-hydroxy nucleic acid ligase n=1 Tax=marine sediment metagenome TaxID=412755 RepID=A0A0F9IEQ2_9ZZZZ